MGELTSAKKQDIKAALFLTGHNGTNLDTHPRTGINGLLCFNTGNAP